MAAHRSKALAKLGSHLRGERGLLLAVIVQAYNDAHSAGHWHEDALTYFDSDTFREHLQLLELNEDLRPSLP